MRELENQKGYLETIVFKNSMNGLMIWRSWRFLLWADNTLGLDQMESLEADWTGF